MPVTTKRVALLIDTSTSWGSGLIEGIAEYANQHGGWEFFLEPRGKHEKLLLPEQWEGHGVIARVTHEALFNQLVERGLPAVNVSWYPWSGGCVARCTADETGAGQACADYLLELGFQHYAYVASLSRPDYPDDFGRAYRSRIEQQGYKCHLFQPEQLPARGASWQASSHELRAWLTRLPKPVGLLTFEDLRGRQITEACRMAGLRVPDDVAVLGGEFDRLSSQISTPKLSSIDLSPAVIGQRAAALLDGMMQGEPPPDTPLLLPVAGIITRQSTDTLAIDDPQLAEAVRFIRSRAHQPIQVADVLAHVPISRRALEQKFKETLGRSPAAEIRHARVQKARRLLVETSDSIPRVAAACGFEYAEVFTRVFRKELGMTPTMYRRQFHREPTQT